MDQQRDFKGVWIPKEIWLDERLNAVEKIILAEIDSLDNEETGCYASNEYIAEFCQCSKTTVSTAISRLIELGFLDLQSFNGRTRILKSRLSNFERQTFKNFKADIQNLKDIKINNKKEDNINNTLNSVESQDLRAVLNEFIKMRKTIKKPLTAYGLELILKKLNKLSPSIEEQIRIVEQSIERCWQGVFALNQEERKQDSQVERAYARLVGNE